jgi:hypothetical protein
VAAKRAVVLEDLREILTGADRIVVKSEPMSSSETLFESTDKKDLVDLWESLALEPPSEWFQFHCMCAGTPALYVYDRGCERLQLTNHHGLSIRCSLWETDVRIIDTEKWLHWFDQRGITAPRQEVEAMRAQQEQNRKDWDKWIAAMPAALKAVWSNALGTFGMVDVVPLRSALQVSTTNRSECILALLEWFGSGAGPWSGFPSYESVAEDLLFDFSTTEIIRAAESVDLSPAQREGLARFFAGWSFGKRRPDGRMQLPEALRQSLWLHSQRTHDKDKYRRAKNAFAR